MNNKKFDEMKIIQKILLLCFLGLVGMSTSNAQNLAGVDFATSLGVADGTLACDKGVGSNNDIGFWRAFPASTCGTNVPCDDRNDGCRGGWCMYDAYAFRNIINADVCIQVNTNGGGCGFNVHGQVYSSPYVPPTTTICSVNDYVANQGGSGTATWGWIQPGCENFYLTYTSVYNTATCNYSFNIDADPLLDLRCAADPAACIEKVTIGGNPVPTMTQWGLFLFGLIILTLGVVTIYNMSTSRVSERG